MRVHELIKRLKECNPKAIVDIQVQDKLVVCDWENDKPVFADEWLEIDDVQQDDNKEFVSIITQMQNLKLKQVQDAIEYLRTIQSDLNPRKAKLGNKPIVWISVNNQEDFSLLSQALKSMRNVKWIGIILI